MLNLKKLLLNIKKKVNSWIHLEEKLDDYSLSKNNTYKGSENSAGNSKKQRCRNNPAHNWTPIIPKIKNTKKHNKSTLDSIGKVSASNETSKRRPREMKKKSTKLIFLHEDVKSIRFEQWKLCVQLNF